MKRLISLIVFIMIVAMPVFVLADTKSYSIDKLIENAVINEEGDIEIQEEFIYNFNGDFNGIYRNLLKNGAANLTVFEVAEKDSKGNITPISKGTNLQNKTYEFSEDSGAWRIKLFSKSSNEIKSFIFRYIIHGAAIKTEASSELYWNFYTVENNNIIKNVELNLSLKNADFNMDKFKYWSYVDEKDFTTNYDSKGLHIKGKDLTSLLGIRVLFQPDYLKSPLTIKDDNNPNTGNYTNNNSNNNIFNNNNSPNYPNNYVRQYNVRGSSNNSFSYALMFAIIVIVVIGIFYYISQENKKFQEELTLYRAQADHYNGEIYTLPPSDLPPALVNFLVYEKYLSMSMISATLFFLSKKGYYTLEKRIYKKTGFFKSVEDEDLAFMRSPKFEMPESPNLQYFINWFSLYENDGYFTLKNIEEQVNNRGGALAFKDQFSKWERILREEASSLGFYTNIYGRKVLTNEYYDEQQKWLAYKGYLINQLNGSTDDAVLENLDDTLIYAQALEVGPEYLENLSRKLDYYSTNTNYNGDSYPHTLYNHNAYHLYPFFFMNLNMWDDINHNINQNSGSSDSSSSNSFSGGDGGNFGGFSDSGGGGFSGGGGGDSGAF